MVLDNRREFLRKILPYATFIAVMGSILILKPNAASYFGMNLLLNLAAPVAFVALAQMFIIAASDIDLSTGPMVGLVTAIASTQLMTSPLLAVGFFVLLIFTYMAAGALIHIRQLPSIVVTLGLAFIWQGCAVMLLPSPGGAVPQWLASIMSFKTWLAPLSIWLMLAGAFVGWIILFAAPYGSVLRGLGGNSHGIQQVGWSVLKAKMVLYGLAGVFNILAGLALAGIIRSGDALVAPEYTLLAIAAVILGGGEFVGGKVSPFGAVAGAGTLVLVSILLSFLNLPSDWQLGSQGLILLAVLSCRALLMKKDTA